MLVLLILFFIYAICFFAIGAGIGLIYRRVNEPGDDEEGE